MGRPPLLTLNIGNQIDDLVCVDILHIPHASGKYDETYYLMQCSICKREKKMKSSTIRNRHGTTHKACGKGLKLVDKVFYQRWCAMRTRTCNDNYRCTHRYKQRGIDSDEFQYFIDFYDAMYPSFKKLADQIGAKNVSLERIDNDKGYSVANCKWIHKQDQQANTCQVIHFEVTFPDGHTEIHKDLRRFCRKHGLNESAAADVMNENRRTAHHRHFVFKRIDVA